YTFLYARQLAHDALPEQPLAFRPKHLVTLATEYQWGAVSVGGDFRYTSRFERVELYPNDHRVAGKVLDLRAGVERGPLSLRCQGSGSTAGGTAATSARRSAPRSRRGRCAARDATSSARTWSVPPR